MTAAPHPELTPREREVYGRIRRYCRASPDGVVPAQYIGSKGACERLAEAGLIVVELDSLGPLGGRYLRYRLAQPAAPDPLVDQQGA